MATERGMDFMLDCVHKVYISLFEGEFWRWKKEVVYGREDRIRGFGVEFFVR